jgi:hypothetical protein
MHLFKVKLNWFLKEKEGVITFKTYSNNHSIAIEDKPILDVSTAKEFKASVSQIIQS